MSVVKFRHATRIEYLRGCYLLADSISTLGGYTASQRVEFPGAKSD